MRRLRRAAALIILAPAILSAGCGGLTSRAAAPAVAGHAAGAAVRFVPPSLATSLAAPGATWAAVPMGAVAGPNLFWQLFMFPSAGTRWSLVTPPDIATNGALILADPGEHALVTGVRPSLYLAYSPITSTRDGGRSWATAPPVAAGLANIPDALAAAPDGQLIALDRAGQAELTGRGHASWTGLTSERSLAATPAGRGCALTGLTAAAYAPTGMPLLAGTCTHPGQAGVFTKTGGAWHAAGPVLPASLAGQTVHVLRLTRIGTRNVALLEAGTGPAASLLAAWTADGGSRWTLSPLFRLEGSQVLSASFGNGGAAAVVLNGNHGETLAGPGASWRRLPALPPGNTVTLALAATGGIGALAADGSKLTAWQLAPGSVAWAKTQAINVPIQYGSSS